jgi:predicted nucleic acid-binding protein
MNPGDFLDTSVLVRYLTGEPLDLAQLARGIVDQVDVLTVTDVVLTEAYDVLTRVYKIPRQAVIDSLVRLMLNQRISVFGLDKDIVIRGLLMCHGSGRVSISDTMIWAAARSAGASTVFTFDQRFPTQGINLRHAP